MTTRTYLLALVVTGSTLVAGCGGGEAKAPAGTTPIKQLIDAGQSPLEVTSFGPAGNMVMPQFKVGLRNRSDKLVKMVMWTALFLDKDGKLLPDGTKEGGYAEVGGIPAGETIEGVMPALEGAAKGKLVLKSVVYETLPPGAENNETMKLMKIDLNWKNAAHDAEVAAIR